MEDEPEEEEDKDPLNVTVDTALQDVYSHALETVNSNFMKSDMTG